MGSVASTEKNAFRIANIECSSSNVVIDIRPRTQDNDGTIKLFLTAISNAPPSGPGFGYKTVRSKAQIYFYDDPARFPEGRDNPQASSALPSLLRTC